MSDTPAPKGERIAKVMARAGLCSRRDAENWIMAGRVSVNGKVLTSAAHNVQDSDDILVDGNPLPKAERTRLWLYHKPYGLVTSHRDEKDRQTVFSMLPPHMPRVVSIGRLDLNSEGLLLLTNDGALARELELPSAGWQRRYRVRVHGRVDNARLARLSYGVTVEGVRYEPIVAVVDDTAGGTKANTWLSVTLTEGKNREVRRVMEHLGLAVNRLIRVAYGPFQLGPLPPSEIEEVPRHILREQLNLKPDADESEDPRAGWAKSRKSGPKAPGKKPFKAGPAKSSGQKSFAGERPARRPERKPDRQRDHTSDDKPAFKREYKSAYKPSGKPERTSGYKADAGRPIMSARPDRTPDRKHDRERERDHTSPLKPKYKTANAEYKATRNADRAAGHTSDRGRPAAGARPDRKPERKSERQGPQSKSGQKAEYKIARKLDRTSGFKPSQLSLKSGNRQGGKPGGKPAHKSGGRPGSRPGAKPGPRK